MCGFAGVLMLDGSRPERITLQRMSQVIRHRGPNESGIHIAGPVGFGFQRLAILDLGPHGHQPMVSADGLTVLAFNGEIYNYVELRGQLEARGHVFRSTGDTEVLLNAYREWGPECLSKLNGMWAFLVYDARRAVLFGSRDRFGEKPLFYARLKDRILFASEIKSIRASGHYQAEFNLAGVAEFFLRGEIDIPRASHETLYRGIHQLPPAHAFELRLDGTWRCWPYWSVDGIEEDGHVADPAGEFARLFEESVRLRLRSDVPVGVFLSGGLDSTSIICSMARLGAAAPDGQRLRAFCFHAEGFDETRYIAETIARTGAEHIPLEASPLDLWGSLDRFFWHQEEPVYSISAVVGYRLAELAASHGVKVILNGQGSDEMLGGYTPAFSSYWNALLRRFGFLDAWREIGAYERAHGAAGRRLFLQTLLQFAKIQFQSFGWYRVRSSRRARVRAIRDPWYTRDLTMHLGLGDVRDFVGGIHHVLKKSLARFPLPFYLRVEDRNAMAHSVETRLPFLDHRLVELALRLGPKWLIRGPWSKFLLRESMKTRIPESVRTRLDKMGFPTPMAAWFAGPLHGQVREVVTSREFRERGLYDARVIERDLERHRRGEINCADRLWDVLQWEKIARLASSDPTVIPSAGVPASSVGSE